MLASSDSKRDKNPEHNTKNMRYKTFCTISQQVTRWMIREISGGQITGAPIENMFKTT